MNGYAGSLLRVDLTKGTSTVETLDPSMVRDYLGGRGFAARILYDEIPAGADPLGLDNKVVIASGCLSGTLVPAGGKVVFASRSPATGGYGESSMGGHVASEMRYAGYDVIVLQGVAPRPSYLYINNGTVEIRDAAVFWGKGAIETETALKQELGEEFQISTIGPAGENRVAFACINHDVGREAGRTGIGAVLGSKNVKAVAIRGTKSIPVADFPKMVEIGKQMYKACFDAPAFHGFVRYGTAQTVPACNGIGGFPTRNFQSGFTDGHESLSHEVMRQEIVINDKSCFSCPLSCGKYSHASTERYDVYVEGPEYETTALIGGNCALLDIKDVAYANYLCDELGMDSISTGVVISFAMECFEKGIITEKETGGIEARFGRLDAFVDLARKIALREGIGNLLADGARQAALALGGGSESFAIHVKGLEVSGYEPRKAPAMMLSYMTADIGAHHNRSCAIWYDVSVGRETLEGKAKRVIEYQHMRPVFDLLGVCRLPWVDIDFDAAWYPRILKAVIGRPLGWNELNHISERIWNLTRMFWIKHVPGFGRQDDMPPARWFQEPVAGGPTEGAFIPRAQVERLLDDYYSLRGWDSDGRPTPHKLASLGLCR